MILVVWIKLERTSKLPSSHVTYYLVGCLHKTNLPTGTEYSWTPDHQFTENKVLILCMSHRNAGHISCTVKFQHIQACREYITTTKGIARPKFRWGWYCYLHDHDQWVNMSGFLWKTTNGNTNGLTWGKCWTCSNIDGKGRHKCVCEWVHVYEYIIIVLQSHTWSNHLLTWM